MAKIRKCIAALVVCIAMSSALALSAYAGSSARSLDTGGITGYLGYFYHGVNIISTDKQSSGKIAVANTQVLCEDIIPSGYVGVLGRVWNANGALLTSADYYYSNGKSSFEAGAAACSWSLTSNPPNVYSYGLIRIMTGNGVYTNYVFAQSPTIGDYT